MTPSEFSPLLRLAQKALEASDHDHADPTVSIALPGAGWLDLSIMRRVSVLMGTLNSRSQIGYNIQIMPPEASLEGLTTGPDLLDPVIGMIGRPLGRHEISREREILKCLASVANVELRSCGLADVIGLVSVTAYAPDCYDTSYKLCLHARQDSRTIRIDNPTRRLPIMFASDKGTAANNLQLEFLGQNQIHDAERDPIDVMRQCRDLQKAGFADLISVDAKRDIETLIPARAA